MGLLLCLPLICASHSRVDDQPEPTLYAQAEQAIAAGQYLLAEQLLQQVVAQNPEWAGAWLDLALLAVRRGEYAQAEEFLHALEERFSPLPTTILQAVGLLRQQIKAQHTGDTHAAANRVRQNSLTLGAGRETNANAGLHLNTLTLTLPDGDMLVDIDPTSQAKAAATARVSFTHYGQEAWYQGSISWQLQMQARQYSQARLNNMEWLAQAAIEQRQLPGRIMLGWQAIWLDQISAYQSPIFRWQYETPLGDLQFEVRQYPQISHLNARWQAYRSTWRCQNGNNRSQFHLQAANETARSTQRPGGDSQHRNWGVQHEWQHPLGYAEHSLILRLERLYTQDASSYSLVLDNGNPRRLRKSDAQITWSGPWEEQAPWRWSIGLQKTTQRSNIQLFNQANTSIETSIWRSW
jgi:tetratricopeptide (TPR) repeat protein